MLRRPADYGEHNMTRKLWSRTETRLWTITLFSGTCMLYAARVALPICAATVAKEYGWSKTDSGTVLSCFFWGYAITQLFAGGAADAIGGENILPHSTLVWSLITIITPQLFDFAYWTGVPIIILIIVRVLTGISQAFHVPGMASMCSCHLTAADKGRVFGIVLAGSHFGTVLAGSVGSVLLDLFGWRILFQFMGFASLLWYFWLKYMCSLKTRKVIGVNNSDDEEEEPLKKDSTPAVHIHMPASPSTVPWAVLFKHPAFWAAGVAQFAGGNAYFTMFNWLPSYFHEEFPAAKGVVYNVVPSLAIVVTSVIAPYMATRLLSNGHSMTVTRKVMEGVSLIGISICLFIVPAAHGFVSALLIFTLAMACRGFHHGGVSVNPHDFAPNHTGSVFGIFNAFGAITGFVGVYVAGHILEATDNNWAYVFVITGLQCIVGAVVYAMLGTGNKII